MEAGPLLVRSTNRGAEEVSIGTQFKQTVWIFEVVQFAAPKPD